MRYPCLSVSWSLALAAVLAAGCRPAESRESREPPPAETPPLVMPSAPTLPEGHPDIGGMRNQTLPAGVMATAENPRWNVPADWQEGPASNVRRASFLVDGPAGQAAEIAVTAFPGDVGGLLANVNRWRAQIGLTPITQDQVGDLAAPLEIGGVAATLVDFTSEAPPPGKSQPQRVIVATVPRGGDSWFFKMTGDAAVVEKERERFLEFLQSVRFE